MHDVERIAKYSFVPITLFLKTGKKQESYCQVILLVDEYNWIHDYKIQWKKLFITQFTTEAHFNKSNAFRFKFRNKVLENIGLTNTPNINGRCKQYIDLKNKQIEKINSLFKSEWIGQTFGNIDYIITGSNPAGQGDPTKSSFYLKNGNQKENIGFLFQSLRLKFKKDELDSNEYKLLWNDYFSRKNNIKQYKDFYEWLNHDHNLKDDFDYFNHRLTPQEQKTKIKKIQKKYCPKKTKYEEICNIVRKYRNDLYSELNKKRKNFTENFWEKKFDDGYINLVEFAHIKPVCEIKQECIKNNFDKEILLEIKDEDNILPLNPDTHTLFDKRKIYWDPKSGCLIFIDQLQHDIVDDNIKNIPQKTLSKIDHFLSWYRDNVICKRS